MWISFPIFLKVLVFNYITYITILSKKLSQMALAKSKLLTPGTAILIGGVCYGSWAIWMARNYFHRSSIRKVYVESDKEYERVHPMQKIQYEGNYKSQ